MFFFRPELSNLLILWQQANVIIHKDRACLTEYGLDSVLSNPKTIAGNIPDGMGRWSAPEIFARSVLVSKPADVFAFAMLAVEVFTGEVPWGKTTRVAAVISKIPRGDRPNRPKDINDVVWGLLTACWDQDPQKRPNIGNVVEKLKIPDESRNEDPGSVLMGMLQ